MDPIIILLTPILVGAIVLLLGFAGCHEIFDVEHVETPPPPPPPFLTLRVRAPAALDIREILFVWAPPNTVGGTMKLTKPDPTGREGDDNLYDYKLSGDPDYGSWTVDCTVIAQIGPQSGTKATGMFIFDNSLTNPVAMFRVSVEGTTLMVMYGGYGNG